MFLLISRLITLTEHLHTNDFLDSYLYILESSFALKPHQSVDMGANFIIEPQWKFLCSLKMFFHQNNENVWIALTGLVEFLCTKPFAEWKNTRLPPCTILLHCTVTKEDRERKCHGWHFRRHLWQLLMAWFSAEGEFLWVCGLPSAFPCPDA